jgi:CRISPR/Cas system-associated exonuclease Cas4 (RecB family)
MLGEEPPSIVGGSGNAIIDAPPWNNSAIEFGELLHESIQFSLTGPGTTEENISHIDEMFDEVMDKEEWTSSMVDTLADSSKKLGRKKGDFFDEEDALEIKNYCHKFLRFLDSNGWLNAIWKSEHKYVSGEVNTKWGSVKLNGRVDLRGEIEGKVVIIEIKSSKKSRDSWHLQAGLYAEMEKEAPCSHVVVWSPRNAPIFSQSEAIENLRFQTHPENDEERAIPFLCAKCKVSDCPERAC